MNNVAQFPTPKAAPRMPIAIAQTNAVVCEECGFDLFMPCHLVRVISALVSPTGKNEKLQIKVDSCVACGHVNHDMLPDGVERVPQIEPEPLTASE